MCNFIKNGGNLMQRMIIATVLLGTVLLTSSWSAAADLKTEDEKTFYAIGLSLARALTIFSLSPAEFDLVKQGLTDAQTGKKSEVELSAYAEKVQTLARSRRKVLSDKVAAEGKVFLEAAAKEKGAVRKESGLVYSVLTEGTGANPKATDTVKVNYRGMLPDGKEFDSSYKRGTPTEFRVDGVIKCWTEALQQMKVGGKAKLVCPSSIAYGDTGAGELILPGATLVFEVELLEIKESKK
jgi:FKBP-type peptidyl-prolyl cis-trans isomerase FkpA